MLTCKSYLLACRWSEGELVIVAINQLWTGKKTVRLFAVILYRRGGKTQLWCESWAGWMLPEVGLAGSPRTAVGWVGAGGGPWSQKAIAMALTFRMTKWTVHGEGGPFLAGAILEDT